MVAFDDPAINPVTNKSTPYASASNYVKNLLLVVAAK